MNPLFAFIHIEKAAGTSFRQFLRSVDGFNLFWHNLDGNLEQVLTERGEDALKEHSGIGGHFSYHEVKAHVRNRKVYFSCILREPKTRILSLHAYIARQKDHPMHEEVRHLSVLESLKMVNAFRVLSTNWQCWRVSGQHKFAKAKKVIDADNFVIGKMEHIDDYMGVLRSAFGLMGTQLNKLNANNSTSDDSASYEEQLRDAELLELLSEITEEDQKLYESFPSAYISKSCPEVLSASEPAKDALRAVSGTLKTGLDVARAAAIDEAMIHYSTLGELRQWLVPGSNLLGIRPGNSTPAGYSSQIRQLKADNNLLRARLALKGGNREGAAKFLHKALHDQPDHASASFELAKIYLADGKSDEGIEYLRIARAGLSSRKLRELDKLCEKYSAKL